ncbi:GNAT family N-acetyltransferase [Phyllobacterium sp. BT25]|uniref:GNAT family N-acetyltransferase n=1 Tax=Phyllobacterium pellucidum TaxID=2740464 RepID=A0A849VV73_9HYPH|nr:GNAT family N-acetyltransferase [Phyllobacterium pellucidum]NTS32519.1 GNAT family N-acetyltransferase [Phyllobacterium pellucidum]
MDADITIRRARDISDFEVAREFVSALGAWDTDINSGAGMPFHEVVAAYFGASPQDLMAKFSEDGADFFIAHIGGEAVGCVGCTDEGDGVGEVHKLYVKPQLRGKRVGLALMTTVMTATYMNEAIALYRGLGFEECEPFDPVPDRITMFMQCSLVR